MMDGDLGLDALVHAVAGLLAASLVGAAIIGMACDRFGRQPLGCASLLMSWGLTVSVGVIAVVLWRTTDGEATRYDWMWAVGLGALGWTIARRLWRRAAAHSN